MSHFLQEKHIFHVAAILVELDPYIEEAFLSFACTTCDSHLRMLPVRKFLPISEEFRTKLKSHALHSTAGGFRFRLEQFCLQMI